MLAIVAHHYVVNSGLLGMVRESSTLGGNDVFLLLFGWGGKTGINCFVFITGYFMCTSKITLRKYMKLIGERYFYAVVFFLIFLISGYASFSVKDFLNVVFPFFNVSVNFTPCFLLFYLFIPFLNKLIHSLNEKEHFLLMCLCLFIYTILPSFAGATVTFNYVIWFMVLYIIASYIRLYPKKFFENTKLWGLLSAVSLAASWGSVVAIAWIGRKFGVLGHEYFFVSDSNKILAVVTAICAFMFFKNLKIKYSKIINTIAASTFGVLLIHANSSLMRQWLWKDVLNNVGQYNSDVLIFHAFFSVVGIYIICTLIDMLRIKFVEKPVFNWFDKKYSSGR